MIQWNHSSHGRESKTVLDSGFRAVELGFPILIVYNDFGFLELYSGFQSPGFWNPQEKVPSFRDSTSKNLSDCGIRIPI